MTVRAVRLLPGALWTVSALLTLGTLVLIVANRDTPFQGFFGSASVEVVFVLLFVSLPTVGAIVWWRRPENPVGWLLVVGGASFAFSLLANEYTVYTRLTAPGALPGESFMLWASSTWSWIPGFGILPAVFLLFPNGRLLSERWRSVLLGLAVGLGVLAIGQSFRPGPYDPPWTSITNPYAPDGVLGDVMTALYWIGNALSVLAVILGAASLLLRFRRARGVERQQLKWLAYSASLLAAYMPFAYLFVIFQPTGPFFIPVSIAGIFIFATVPIATGIAILRYRLYDIDLLINRTVVYGATSAAIAATFFLGIVALQSLLRPLTSGSELAVAASTLMSFALFAPVRRRVQGAVDRRFDRSRYDAARTLDFFADRLRDEVDLDALRGDLLGVVRQTMSPGYVSLWLRERAK